MPYKSTCKSGDSTCWCTTYLDDQILERLFVLGRVLVEVRLELGDCVDLETLDALSALLHLLKARLVVAARHHLAVLDHGVL